MKAKISPNLLSFIPVRRGDWILKVSVYKNRQIMVFAMHCFEMERAVVQFFRDQNSAAEFIEQLIIED